ncbi:hypothetical protein JXA88_12375 [Candidatus Fermentibacteria bacterium]|nr:hypothetical protein [Candidatus Fermentibacteria bacterium]
MTDLILRDFDVPELPSKTVDPLLIDAWIAENLLHLKESGLISAMRNQPSRRPSPIRFRLSHTAS